jgi:hypothetical protein
VKGAVMIMTDFTRIRMSCIMGGVTLALALMATCSTTWADDGTVPDQAPTGPEGCYCIGTVGNVNCDYRDRVTVADVSLLIAHLFISGVRLPNLEEANIDGDPDGVISLGDITLLIDHLFISGQPLRDCPKAYNNPPETFLSGVVTSYPFINAVAPDGPYNGVRLSWSAQDLVDHAYDNPTFTFEYRLYGPYSDAVYAQVTNLFMRRVFITTDGRMIRYGEGGQYVICDTTWLPGGVRAISCDTVLIDTLYDATNFGWIDTLFDVEAAGFLNNQDYNRLAASSGTSTNVWTYNLSDSLYNLFASYPTDTTVTANFIAWVRARDPRDSTVYDLTPAFGKVRVIEMKRERDIAVIDFGTPVAENRPKKNTQRSFWSNAVPAWAANTGLSDQIQFDQTNDWRHVADFVETTNSTRYDQLLSFALKHKVVVVIQDMATSGAWSIGGVMQTALYQAIEAGTNVWVAARVPLGNLQFTSPLATTNASLHYQYYFGVNQYTFPGWGSFSYNSGSYGLPRTEDFIGANSLDTSLWPNLAIDTALLRNRYIWEGCIPAPACYEDELCNPLDCFPFYPYSDPNLAFLGALPQVGWIMRTYESEAMYTYKSLYGTIHEIDPALSFDGRPVMIRLDKGKFRTTHSLFTPLALEATSGQKLVDAVLSWLYEKYLPSNSAKPVGVTNPGRE